MKMNFWMIYMSQRIVENKKNKKIVIFLNRTRLFHQFENYILKVKKIARNHRNIMYEIKHNIHLITTIDSTCTEK